MRRVRVRRPVLLIVATGAALLAASEGAGAHNDEAAYRVLAGSRKDARDLPARAEAQESLGGLRIRVEYLDAAARAAFIRSIDASLGDPFAVPPGRPERFTSFRVAFENGSRTDVQFQAGNVVMITDRNSQDFPIDLTDLYRIAAGAGADDPQAAIDRVAPVLFDSSTTIGKGRSVEKLLVFGPFPAKWRDLQLHFSYLQIGTETHTVSFIFHKQPLKE